MGGELKEEEETEGFAPRPHEDSRPRPLLELPLGVEG